MLMDVTTSGETENLRDLDTTGSSASMSLMLEEEAERDSVNRQLSEADRGSPALGAAKKRLDGPRLVSICRMICRAWFYTLICVG